MAKVLGFKSCVDEFLSIGVQTPTTYRYIAVGTPTEVATKVPAAYASDPQLAGKVTGIGYGWQKYVVDITGKSRVTIRGAAGGMTAYAGETIDPVTGDCTLSRVNKGGRGAKLVADIKFTKGEVLYILVGMRGWCNANNIDWGGGGGGASVILRVNPSGPYTFGPTGEKVEILLVAGGGGGSYDQSYGNVGYYHGGDALYTDGTNTNGGSSASSRGGAGMTGSGSGGSGGPAAPSILSGNPIYTSDFGQIHQGGWGGGGGSYDGGGGGAGYSGGASTSNSRAGNGGTSYMNPVYCTEVFRGYATVAEDSQRNLTNPWTAYGYVEITMSREESKLILAKDEDGYKWFDGHERLDGTINPAATNTWRLLDDQDDYPADNIFRTYGNTIITSSAGLKSPVRFLIGSLQIEEQISISANLNGAMLIMSKDAKVSDVWEFLSSTLTANLTNTTVKFAISTDHGKKWFTFDTGEWVQIDINNREIFQNQGYDLGLLASIPMTNWNKLKAKSIRFAFCITQFGTNSAALKLEQIEFLANLNGSWVHCTDAEVSYQYPSADQLLVKFTNAGSYKVNYMDKLVAEETEE